MWTVKLDDMDATLALGRALGRVVSEPALVSLVGELGAGKTTFAQGVGVGLELSSAVVSPTFILMAEHPDGRLPLLHGDAYRLKPGEAEGIGLDETIDAWPGLVLMEWGDPSRTSSTVLTCGSTLLTPSLVGQRPSKRSAQTPLHC